MRIHNRNNVSESAELTDSIQMQMCKFALCTHVRRLPFTFALRYDCSRSQFRLRLRNEKRIPFHRPDRQHRRCVCALVRADRVDLKQLHRVDWPLLVPRVHWIKSIWWRFYRFLSASLWSRMTRRKPTFEAVIYFRSFRRATYLLARPGEQKKSVARTRAPSSSSSSAHRFRVRTLIVHFVPVAVSTMDFIRNIASNCV